MLNEKLRLMVWLDDLLDTRLSTMLWYDFHKTIEAIPRGYDRRTSDLFISDNLGITKEKWEQLYARRDENILVRSARTGVVDFIRELLAEEINNYHENFSTCPGEITINTWPYTLPKEAKEGWVEVMKEMIHPLIKVNVVKRKYTDCNPTYIVENFNYVIHYDWDVWLRSLYEANVMTPMLLVTVIGPRIFKDEPTEEERKDFGDELNKFDLHMLAEYMAGYITQLRLLDVDLWIAYKDKRNLSDEVKGRRGGVPPQHKG